MNSMTCFFFASVKQQILAVLTPCAQTNAIKWNLSVQVELTKQDGEETTHP